MTGSRRWMGRDRETVNEEKRREEKKDVSRKMKGGRTEIGDGVTV